MGQVQFTQEKRSDVSVPLTTYVGHTTNVETVGKWILLIEKVLKTIKAPKRHRGLDMDCREFVNECISSEFASHHDLIVVSDAVMRIYREEDIEKFPGGKSVSSSIPSIVKNFIKTNGNDKLIMVDILTLTTFTMGDANEKPNEELADRATELLFTAASMGLHYLVAKTDDKDIAKEDESKSESMDNNNDGDDNGYAEFAELEKTTSQTIRHMYGSVFQPLKVISYDPTVSEEDAFQIPLGTFNPKFEVIIQTPIMDEETKNLLMK